MGAMTFTPSVSGWRWYAEDGTFNATASGQGDDTLGTAHGSEDANLDINIQTLGEQPSSLANTGQYMFQTRTQIQESGGANGSTSDTWLVQFSCNNTTFANGSSWLFYYGNSTSEGNLWDQDSTTETLTAGSGSYVAGVQCATNNESNHTWRLTSNDYGDLVFGHTIREYGFADGDVIYFRQNHNGSNLGSSFGNITVRRNFIPTFRAFRFYEDDAAPASATAIAAEDTNITRDHTTTERFFNIRVGLQAPASHGMNGANGGGLGEVVTIEARKNGGSWFAPNGTASNLRAVASSNYAADASSAATLGQRLSNGTGSYTNGKHVEDATAALWERSVQIEANEYSEILYAFEIVEADNSVDDYYEFRLVLGRNVTGSTGIQGSPVEQSSTLMGGITNPSTLPRVTVGSAAGGSITGDVTGSATPEATFSVDRSLTGDVTGSASPEGVLSRAFSYVGDIAAAASVAGLLTIGHTLIGDVPAAAQVDAGMQYGTSYYVGVEEADAGGALVTSLTIPGYELGPGSDRILIVQVAGERAGATPVATATYSGTAMTEAEQFAQVDGGDATISALFYMLEAALVTEGSPGDVVVNFSNGGIDDGVIRAYVLRDMEQGAPLRTATDGGNSVTSLSPTILADEVGDVALDSLATTVAEPITSDAGQTEIANAEYTSLASSTTYKVSTGTSQTQSFDSSWDNAQRPAWVGAVVKSKKPKNIDLTGDVTGAAIPDSITGRGYARVGDIRGEAIPEAVLAYVPGVADYFLTGDVTGAAIPEATLSIARNLTGDITGAATPEADLSLARSLTGDIIGAATPEAVFAVARTLTGDIAGAAYPEATLSVARYLTGDITGAAVPEALLSQNTTENLVGDVTGAATPEAVFSVARTLTGDVAGSASPEALLSAARYLTGDVTGEAIPAAVMSQNTTENLVGDVTGAAVPEATFSIVRTLVGDIVGAATPEADLTIARYLTGDITGAAVPEAILSQKTVENLTGDITGEAVPEAAFSIARVITGDITGAAVPEATLTVNRYLVGDITGEAIPEAILSQKTVENLVGDISGAAEPEALFSIARTLSGDVTGAAEVAAGLSVARSLTGDVRGSAEPEALLSAARNLTGDVRGEAEVAAVMEYVAGSASETIVGDVSGAAVPEAIFTVDRTLVGDVTGEAIPDSIMAVGGPVPAFDNYSADVVFRRRKAVTTQSPEGVISRRGRVSIDSESLD